MAKKYVSLEKLGLYNDKIKKVIADADAAALKSAKDYADSLAPNYDAVGSAAGAQAAAKSYTDAEVAKANTAAATAQAAAEAAATAASTADGKAVAAQAAADKAQGEVDALEVLVGALPEGTTAKTVIEYVNKKTEGIATDAALGELNSQVSGLQTAIQGIQADYLKAEDYTELEGKVTAEADRAKGVESGLDTRIKAVEDDYLKAADKAELVKDIEANAAAIERLTNGVSQEEIDGVNDLINYVNEHGTEVTGMKEDIADNAAAIATEAERAKGEEAKNAAAAAAAKTAADDAQAAADAEAERAAGVESGLDTRLKAVEAAVGESGSVADDIATAKQEAIDAAATDATSKANTAEANAKGHADSLNTAMNTRVEALEAIDHEHSNKALLDTYTQTEANLADAVAKKHAHTNLEVLEGITSAKVTAWDAAEQNAKTYAKNYADGLNSAMDTRMVAVEAWQTNMVEASEEDINGLFA